MKNLKKRAVRLAGERLTGYFCRGRGGIGGNQPAAPLGKAERSEDVGAIAIAIAGLVVSAATPVLAEGGSTVAVQRLGPPEIEARRESLLKQMIARPNDLDLAFEYAQLSSQVGDYEGAISTLERMLIYSPNTPRLQLELGVLYTASARTTWPAPISCRPLPTRPCRRRSPLKSASISSSSRSPPSRPPSPPRSSHPRKRRKKSA